jgi:PAS domain S-box-containing protein
VERRGVDAGDRQDPGRQGWRPKIQRRVLLALALVATLFGGVQVAVLKAFVLPSYAELETDTARGGIDRVLQEIEQTLEQLGSTAGDYADWDDAWDFVTGRRPDYATTNFSAASMVNLDLSAVAVFGLRGELLLSRERGEDTTVPLRSALADSLSEVRRTLADSEGAATGRGVIATELGGWLFAAHAIHRNDGAPPARGTLVLARPVDGAYLDRVARHLDLDIMLWPVAGATMPSAARAALATLNRGPQAPLVQAVDAATTAAWALVPGPTGDAVLLLRVEIPRLITAAGWRAAWIASLVFLLAALMILVVLAVLLQHGIVAPLTALTGQVDEIRRTGDLSRPIAPEREDEIGRLAQAFEAMRAQLHTAREQLGQLLGTSPVAIYGYAPDQPGRLLLAGDNAPRLFGLVASDGAARLRDWVELVAPGDRSRLMEAHAAARRGTNARAEYRLQGPMGGERWIMDELRPVRDAEGRPTRVVGSWTDITELKRTQADLGRLAQAAEAASRAKSAFLALMSHEIRTPLSALLGFADLLAAAELPTEQARYATIIRDSGKVLLTILNDILDFAKLEAGRLSLESVAVEVHAMLREAMAGVELLGAEKGLEFRLEIEPGLPRLMLGDPVRLKQILLNLLANAVKFTERGHVALRARAIRAEGGRAALRVEIEDTGIGIEQVELPRLFQMFEQADLSITRRFGGTGLGLAICRQLVGMMGGRIGVASEPGVGSTFWFELPLQQPRAPAMPAKADRADAAAPIRPGRVLVVDDTPTNRLLLQALLREQRQEVVLAADGVEAVDHAAREAFDLILMDIHMPRLDGLAAARAIRAGGGPNAATAIVALTADVMEGSRAAGMDGHLGKPVDRARLRAILAGQLGLDAVEEPARVARPHHSSAGRSFATSSSLGR